jgi:hypothetical protein
MHPRPPSSEKTLPTAAAESPYQKKLIFVFISIAVLAVIGLGAYRWFSARDSFSLFKDQVLSGLKKEDTQLLLTLANKEFLIGQGESENGATVPPEKVIKQILQLSKTTKWSNNFQEFETLRILYPDEGKFQLVFTKNLDQWRWSGFLANNPEDVTLIIGDDSDMSNPGRYKEIKSEEATDN